MENLPETLDTIRCGVRERLLAFRSLERLVESEEFSLAYEKACPKCKVEINEHIANLNLQGIKHWIAKENAPKDYGALTLRVLRSVAQRLGVPHYSRLPKASLLSEISNYEKRRIVSS